MGGDGTHRATVRRCGARTKLQRRRRGGAHLRSQDDTLLPARCRYESGLFERLVPLALCRRLERGCAHLRKWMDAQPVISWVGVQAEALPVLSDASVGSSEEETHSLLWEARLLEAPVDTSPRRTERQLACPISQARRFRSEAAVAAESLAELKALAEDVRLRDDVEFGPQAITLLEPLATLPSLCAALEKRVGELEARTSSPPLPLCLGRWAGEIGWWRGGGWERGRSPTRVPAHCRRSSTGSASLAPSASSLLPTSSLSRRWSRRRARRHFTRFPRSTGPRRWRR